jgi:hypothetical membrane protein
MTSLSVRRSRLADRASLSADLRAAGVLAFLTGATFLVGTMLAASIAPGYDFHAAAISDLGTIGETAALFNAVLIATGLLDLAMGLLLVQVSGHRAVLVPILMGGLGAIGAGVFPLDTGAPHTLFALAAFVGFNLEALACARIVRGPMRWISLLAGVVGLAYVGIMVIGDAGDPAMFEAIGHGGSERMIAYPVMAWLLAFGGYLMATETPDRTVR